VLSVPVQAAQGYSVFPRPYELFSRLLADPRQIQIAAYYYRQDGDDTADVALGHSWGLTRWQTGDQSPWNWQWSVEGMAYSRFRLNGGVNEFQTIDFFANLPLELRREKVSGKFMLFHESSHLGDDYIRHTGDQGFRYSLDGLKALASYEPAAALRIYAGGFYLLHTVPSPHRPGLQAGLELKSPDRKLFSKAPYCLYLGQDIQSRASVSWNTSYRTVFGVRLGLQEQRRFMRVHLGHYAGRSPFGQFFRRQENHWDLGVSFDL